MIEQKYVMLGSQCQAGFVFLIWFLLKHGGHFVHFKVGEVTVTCNLSSLILLEISDFPSDLGWFIQKMALVTGGYHLDKQPN